MAGQPFLPKREEVLAEAQGLIVTEQFINLDKPTQYLILKLITLCEEKK